MVIEHALIDVTPGEEPAFEAALEQARRVIAASPGFLGARVHRGVEQPSRYLLLVEWEHLDDHLVGFRQSDAFRQWRALLGPYFAADPIVDHFVVHGDPIQPGPR